MHAFNEMYFCIILIILFLAFSIHMLNLRAL